MTGAVRERLNKALVQRQALESHPSVKRIFNMPNSKIAEYATLMNAEAGESDKAGPTPVKAPDLKELLHGHTTKMEQEMALRFRELEKSADAKSAEMKELLRENSTRI